MAILVAFVNPSLFSQLNSKCIANDYLPIPQDNSHLGLAIGASDWDSDFKKEGTRWLHHMGMWPRVPSDRGRRSRPSLFSSNRQLTLSRYVTEGTILDVLIARGALCHLYAATGTFRNRYFL